MRYRLGFTLALLGAVACNSPSSAPVPPTPPDKAAQGMAQEPPLEILDADPREAMLGHAVSQLLAAQHLRQRPVDDEVSRLAFAEYLERLDPGKLFLLERHAARLSTYADLMDDELRDGDLELARTGAALLAARQKVVAQVVAERLAKPFDYDIDEQIETDPDKRGFAVSEQALADRWRKLLKLQVLERVDRMEEVARALESASSDTPDAGFDVTSLGDIPATYEAREQKAREDLAKSYEGRFSRLARIEPLEPVETFLNAVASIYDPHTLYMAPVDKENFDIEMTGSLEGIGAVLSEDDHYIVVREIVPGGASWREGQLKAGDLILAVRQAGKEPVDVGDMRLNEVVQMIRGPKGTVVTLTVKKADGRVESIAITRDVVEIEAAYARGALLDLGPKHAALGYIYLPRFYGNTRAHRGKAVERNATDDVRALLERFQAKKVGGVVLDLRGNGGGLLDHARDISGLLIDTGPVVQTRYSNGDSDVLGDEDAGVSFDGAVVVLVDRFSASASEILAGAMQDYRRAVIVGTGPTHGKGTVQVLIDLDRLAGGMTKPLGVLKLTIQQYFRVNGESTQARGVIPDILLPGFAEHLDTGEGTLDHAIPWSSVEPLEHAVWPRGTWDVAALTKASEARRGKHPVFDLVAKRGAFFEARSKQTTLSLERAVWKARRDEDRAKLEALDPKLDEGKARFTVDVVDYVPGAERKRRAAEGSAAAARLAQWQDALARDPWVEEALFILSDMVPAR